jgi:hypothetical protein
MLDQAIVNLLRLPPPVIRLAGRDGRSIMANRTKVSGLAPMVIVPERGARVEHLRLHIRGFYERQTTWGREGMGFGQFLGPEELVSPPDILAVEVYVSIGPPEFTHQCGSVVVWTGAR